MQIIKRFFMIHVFCELFKYVRRILGGKYWFILVLFFLWLYRIDFIVSDGGGFAKVLQVASVCGMLIFVFSYNKNIINYTCNNTNVAIKSLFVLYLFALISTLWAFIPSFAFFLSFQNLVVLLLFVWLFSRINRFDGIERLFIYGCIGMILFEAVVVRLLSGFHVFVHFLPCASSAAMLFAYSVAEYLRGEVSDMERRRLLKGCMWFTFLVLVANTSGSANVSAFVAVGIALFLSRKKVYAIICLTLAIIIWANLDKLDSLLLFLMPGKTLEVIESGNGRDYIWNRLLLLAEERPMLGWGFACVERVNQSIFDGQSLSDAHSNYIGMYGSLGLFGLCVFVVHILYVILYMLKRIRIKGFLGLFCAYICLSVNGYSYGFLSGKTCSITVCYIVVIVLSFFFNRVYEKNRSRIER